MTEPAEVPDVLYVPVAADEEFAGVWAINAEGLTYISNVTEKTAREMAATELGHIYFFAELIMGEPGVEIYDAMFVERLSIGDGELEEESCTCEPGSGSACSNSFCSGP